MRDTFIFTKESPENVTSLEVDPEFLASSGKGDYVRVGEKEFEIQRKIYDPRTCDLYLEVSSLSYQQSDDQEYINFLIRGEKLQAVKLRKEKHPEEGLKEAKEYIDSLIEKYGF